jgi:hypothetical protein
VVAPEGLRVLRSDGKEDLYEDSLRRGDERSYAVLIDSWHGFYVHDDGRLDVIRNDMYEGSQHQRYVACYSAGGWQRVDFGREFRWTPPARAQA